MKTKLIIVLVFLSLSNLFAQEYTLQTGLDTAVNETSGLILLNNTLITHNDSGNAAELYEINVSTGAVTRTVSITNATNIDWEDITHDDTYIYIGDFGNFNGERIDLKIYKILIADYLSNTSITAEIINYSYSDQTDFTSSPFSKFDAEALIHFNNKLYIFTKDWQENKTDIYELPKDPGNNSANLIDSFDSQGLITGAEYNTASNTIALCGYSATSAFIITLDGFNNGLFSNGTITRTDLSVPNNYSMQTEAITALSDTEYYVSSERMSSDFNGLYSFNTSTLGTADILEEQITFYPNPANKTITLNKNNCLTRIYSTSGNLVLTTSENVIDISNFASGIYVVEIQQQDTNKSTKKQLIID